MRDHGGNLDEAMARYGGTRDTWVDLSTGINPRAYPVANLPPHAWQALPTQSDLSALIETARCTYGAPDTCAVLPLAGAQAAIQLVPRLGSPGKARVLTPTYNEHAAQLRIAGWDVSEVATLDQLTGADLAVVVNPNNPDGQCWEPGALVDLATRVRRLVVDESFVDPTPDASVIPHLTGTSILVLRSFGKFYGLAGVRLGFAVGAAGILSDLRDIAGPWPVSGAAIVLGRRALGDTGWQTETIERLHRDCHRLDALAMGAGWSLIGGTALFRLYETPSAARAQDLLAQAHIWTRRFPWSETRLRLGLPDGSRSWTRLDSAMSGFSTLEE